MGIGGSLIGGRLIRGGRLLQGAGGAAAYDPTSHGTVWAWYKKGVGMAVSQWDDSKTGGTAQHLKQGTAGNQPTVSGSSLVFDGTDDWMVTDNSVASSVVTIALRFKQIANSGAKMIAQFAGGAIADRMNLSQTGTGAGCEIYNGTAVIAATGERAVGTFDVSTIVFNGASSVIRFIDAGADDTGNPGTLGGLRFNIGAYATGFSPSNVAFEEIIVWTTAVDSTGRSATNTYLDGL